jgi:mannose-6-phosphate isomerase-like protein (cupin superfamily)
MAAPKEAWSSRSVREEKPWGHTWHWHTNSSMHGKQITIRKGERTSLKYHTVKNEVFFVMSGKLLVTYGNSKTLKNQEKYPFNDLILVPGEVFNVQSECPYRFEALEESVIIEIGDRNDNDPVRLEDDYGRAKK